MKNITQEISQHFENGHLKLKKESYWRTIFFKRKSKTEKNKIYETMHIIEPNVSFEIDKIEQLVVFDDVFSKHSVCNNFERDLRLENRRMLALRKIFFLLREPIQAGFELYRGRKKMNTATETKATDESNTKVLSINKPEARASYVAAASSSTDVYTSVKSISSKKITENSDIKYTAILSTSNSEENKIKLKIEIKCDEPAVKFEMFKDKDLEVQLEKFENKSNQFIYAPFEGGHVYLKVTDLALDESNSGCVKVDEIEKES